MPSLMMDDRSALKPPSHNMSSLATCHVTCAVFDRFALHMMLAIRGATTDYMYSSFEVDHFHKKRITWEPYQ